MTPADPQSARVAILIRTKQRPLLLARALDDILNQTYQDWEAVVVNDGGSPGEVDDLIEHHRVALRGRLKVVHNRDSLGMESASNTALKESRGELVVVHDDDDTWSPEFLEQAVAWLDARPEQLAVAVCTDIIVERIEQAGIIELSRETMTPPFERLSLFDLLLANRIPPIGMLLRRRTLIDVGTFDETLPVLGDWDVTLKIALRGPIGYIAGPPLAFWHQRPQSEDTTSNSVFGQADVHRQFDREIRDRALRDYVERNGVGGLLFIARFLDERLAESRHDTWQRTNEIESRILARIDSQSAMLERAIAAYTYENGVFPSLRRAATRALGPRHQRRRDHPL